MHSSVVVLAGLALVARVSHALAHHVIDVDFFIYAVQGEVGRTLFELLHSGF